MLTCFAVICGGAYLMHLAVMSSVTPEQQDHWGPVLTRSVLAHLPLFLIGVMTAFVFVHRQALSQVSSSRVRIVRDVVLVMSAIAVFLILSTPLDDWFQIPFGRYNLPYIPLLLAIMICVTPDSGLAAKFLEFAPLRLLGVISYGFFIYHLAVMGLVSRAMGLAGRSPQTDALAFAGASILLTVAVASASYLLVEQPLIGWLAGRRQAESTPAMRPAAAELR
jgi:peptidoglycan/LPS O-acetylase OafA/YrhL